MGLVLIAASTLLSTLQSSEAANRRRSVAPHPSATTQAGPAAQSLQRQQFTTEDQQLATIPNIPNARFWGDSDSAFLRALPVGRGAWLALSGGGADGAFGAGLLNGMSKSGQRPEFSVITGVSTGAMMAPYAFLGTAYDDKLREVYTAVSAADIFEAGATQESLVDTWPLKKFVAKHITPELLAAVAAEHRRGRRLFVVTTNLDAERPVVWNMGAIAEKGDDAALRLFRDVLMASSAVPGIFPPVHIDVTADGRTFREMHADGGMNAPFYVAPTSMLINGAALPASELYVIVNSKLAPSFHVVPRDTSAILGRSIDVTLKAATRAALTLVAAATQRSGAQLKVAYIDSTFNQPSRGAFDPDYMTALYKAGEAQGMRLTPFMDGPQLLPNHPTLVGSRSNPQSTDGIGANDGGDGTAADAVSGDECRGRDRAP